MKNLFQDNLTTHLPAEWMNGQRQEQNIILTGVTGAVGSHILFELLRQYAENKFFGKLILLVRPNLKMEITAYQRVVNLLINEYAPDYLSKYDTQLLLSFIEVIACDLGSETLEHQLAKFHDLKNCYVIHSAATTNLGITQKAYEENYSVNYCGSLNLLNACKAFAIKFCFISTAYSCGIQTGLIPNDFNTLEKKNFRNHYEAIKAKLEIKLAAECKALNIKYQILRPAIVSGRLLDPPFHVIANFSVFYAYGKFFYMAQPRNDSHPINIKCHQASGLHIIPVDYVAKVITAVFANDEFSAVNIAPEKRIKQNIVIPTVTREMGYTNIRLVTKREEKSNVTEELYYKMIDSAFGPYVATSIFEFDVSPLKKILPDVKIPNIATHLPDLLAFAVNHEFKPLESFEIKTNQPSIIVSNHSN